MHKLVRRKPWTCARCLRQQQRYRHTAAGAATATATLDSTYDSAYLHASPVRSSDNALLREVFNNKGKWRTAEKKSSGLIGNKHLTTPRGFQKFAETAVAQCKRLVERTLAASTVEEYRAIPRDLDRLSDLLCRVIDLSDFIRSIHPDSAVAAAASASYSLMFQYMNELNTTTGLNQQLKKAWEMPEVLSHWNEEEKTVAQLLMKDFAKSGIDLPEQQRQQFVSLSNDIAQVGTDFVNQMDHAKDHVTFSLKQLDGVDPTLVQGLKSWERVQIPVYSSASKVILNSAKSPATRRTVYVAERTASRQTISRLEQLLLRRAQLAKLTGYDSYAQMTLADKMSKTPAAVSDFLESLNANNRVQVQKELAPLLELKRKLDEPNASSIDPWDHSYLLAKLAQFQAAAGPRTSKSRLRENASNYFAIGHVMQGLSNLFESLYGVRLVPKETCQGEVWHPEVRRLDVYTDKEEHIATMYCDLFSRPGKLPNPAHFTLLCSREISDEEVMECQQRGEPLNDGMPTIMGPSVLKRDPHARANYQIPIIALVCGFPDPSTSVGPAPSLLSLHSVTTLFHEMGHAIHSILGRTSMQGISGTRCATDFAELPSVLMEYFATDPAVLKTFARHWQTDAVIPDELLTALADERTKQAERSGGWNNEAQILMSILDQVYHSTGPVEALRTGRYNSTAVYHDVWNKYGSVPEPPETAWQGFFGHLYGYGASYYSYLFDRAIARQVWRTVFKDGQSNAALDRAAGERFKQEVLRWGGGRDPWLCLEGLMGDGRGVLAEGGQEAMLEVGKWGVGASSEGSM
ncbi:Mitochondrial intermediate peptidase [Exophiala dermatitidis]